MPAKLLFQPLSYYGHFNPSYAMFPIRRDDKPRSQIKPHKSPFLETRSYDLIFHETITYLLDLVWLPIFADSKRIDDTEACVHFFDLFCQFEMAEVQLQIELTIASVLESPAVSYDSAGNLLAWNGNFYAYDPFNLISRIWAGGEEWIYLYTADNERVWQFKVDASPRFDRWTLRDLSGKVLREYTATGYSWEVEEDYIYRDGLLLASMISQGLRHFHLDHLGTPRLVTDGNGNQIAYHLYYPFGEEASDPFQDQERMKFTGHERDLHSPSGTGDDLDYMMARHCSPLTARFLTVDPILSADPSVAQSWNKYLYALNNPLRLVDPTGLMIAILDPEALRLIQETLPDDVQGAVVLTESGMISAAAINAISNNDANFLSLKKLVNSDVLIEVSTASGFQDAKGNSHEFVFESVQKIREELAASIGREAAEQLEIIPTSFLGVFNPPNESLRSTAEAIISDATGSAATAPFAERVVTMAHELFGHGLLFAQGKPFKHDRGPVDSMIDQVEKRTRRRLH